MYVLVHHTVTDPKRFWATVADATPNLPANLKLHQTLTARDGTKATCLWEAESVEAVRTFLDPAFSGMSRNEYAEAENREGLAVPSRIEEEVSR